MESALESVRDYEEGPDEVAHVESLRSAGVVDVDQGDGVGGGEDSFLAEGLRPPGDGCEDGKALKQH